MLMCTSLLAAAVAISGCGGTKEGSGNTKGDKTAELTEPVYGGTAIYGISGWRMRMCWCSLSAQLAPPGILEARAIYDTLTIPDENGRLVPFLAKSLTHNDDFTEWDIQLRDGVKFHDGTALDSTVVKNNIDAYRGAYPARESLLFRFVYDNIADVAVTGPLALKVTTKSPWSSLPQALWSTGRVGIMAQAQLDDPTSCATKLIGTGPFSLVEWKQNEKLELKKNPDYWMADAKGNKLPYLDSIEFRPMTESSARTNALLSGEVNMISAGTPQMMEALKPAEDDGKVRNNASDAFTTVSFLQFNNAAAPFDNKDARLAVINAIDMETFNQTVNLGMIKIANGPFPPGSIGYVKDNGYPTFDLDKAKKYGSAYEAKTGEKLKFSLMLPAEQLTNSAMALVQEMLKKAGIDMQLQSMEVAAMVSTAVSGKYQAMAFANYPGGDPDDNRVWWYGGSPVNLSKFNDPEINRLLDEGRSTDDEKKRQQIYGDINKQFASEGYSAWLNWTLANVATSSDVHGLLGPALPGGEKPSPSLVNGHSMAGIWID
ncbi:MAG: ABC transporter substrate-binding protein [Microthrixaceae bacterium]